ncbi:hypothetical protein ACOSQ3_002466 [Xanthoceras sorbifolium]
MESIGTSEHVVQGKSKQRRSWTIFDEEPFLTVLEDFVANVRGCDTGNFKTGAEVPSEMIKDIGNDEEDDVNEDASPFQLMDLSMSYVNAFWFPTTSKEEKEGKYQTEPSYVPVCHRPQSLSLTKWTVLIGPEPSSGSSDIPLLGHIINNRPIQVQYVACGAPDRSCKQLSHVAKVVPSGTTSPAHGMHVMLRSGGRGPLPEIFFSFSMID